MTEEPQDNEIPLLEGQLSLLDDEEENTTEGKDNEQPSIQQ